MYVGWIIILILLWIRPEYLFLLFYVFANLILSFLIFDIWNLTWADAPSYALHSAINITLALTVGAAIVALFKWLKTRKTGADAQRDREIAHIRAEIAAGANNADGV